MKTLCVSNPGEKSLYRPIVSMYGIDRKEAGIIKDFQREAWERCLNCFSKIKDPYYNDSGICPYHVGQYLTFLYFLSNTIYRKCLAEGGQQDNVAQSICDKIFMTSMTISSADIYYAHSMPDVFLPLHPLGAVLTGRAKIGDFFVFMQGCNLGINKGVGPQLGERVVMWGNSKIVGDCHVGNNVMFSANSYIKDMDIPDNAIVFGQYPNVIIKKNCEDEINNFFEERFYL